MPYLHTNAPTPKILDVPHPASCKASTSTLNLPLPPRCISANQATFPTVALSTEPFSIDCTSKKSLIQPKARSLLSQISAQWVFARNQSNDIILLAGTWPTGCAPTKQIFLSGYKSVTTHRSKRLGCSCLDYVNRESSFFPIRHLMSSISPNNSWLSIRLHESRAYLKYVYQPPSSNHF